MTILFAALALMAAPQEGPAAPAVQIPSMYAFGDCAARDTRLVQDLFSSVPGTSQEASAITALLRRGCSTMPEFSVDPTQVRGVVAEALFKRDYGTLDGTVRAGKVRMFAFPSSEGSAIEAGSRYQLGMLALGRCVVDAAPADSVALLNAVPGSAGERAAFSTLAPTLGSCVDTGSTANLSRGAVRSAIAEAAYRKASGVK